MYTGEAETAEHAEHAYNALYSKKAKFAEKAVNSTFARKADNATFAYDAEYAIIYERSTIFCTTCPFKFQSNATKRSAFLPEITGRLVSDN